MSGDLHVPVALSLGKETSIHTGIGDWVDHRAGGSSVSSS